MKTKQIVDNSVICSRSARTLFLDEQCRSYRWSSKVNRFLNFFKFFTCYFYHHLSAPIEFFFSLLALHFRWDLQFFEPFSVFFFFVSFGKNLVNLRLIADDIGFTSRNNFFSSSNEKIILSLPSFSVLFSKDIQFF